MMLKFSNKEKIERHKELLSKKNNNGLTLTEAYEFDILTSDVAVMTIESDTIDNDMLALSFNSIN